MQTFQTVEVLGDSVLKGIILDEKNGKYRPLVENCAAMVQKCLGISIINRSCFGCTVEKGNRLLERELKKGLKCDMVLLEFGGNDCDFDWKEVSAAPEKNHLPRTALNQFIKTMTTMVHALQKNGIRPILMSLPPVDGARYFQFLTKIGMNRENLLHFLGDTNMISRFHESYSLAVTRLAQELQCLYVPIREAFLSNFCYGNLMCADGIHPSREGHVLMKQVFLDAAAAAVL